MDRRVTFTGAIPLVEDFLDPQRAAMVALASLSEAVLGRSTVIDGLIVAPTVPTSLAVNVGIGSLYALAALDAQAYGALPADTAHSIVKQGVQLDPLRIPIAPPGTPGYSQAFLLQANFQEVDAGALVLPYYNSANPSQAWAGPSNSGAQQYTRRNGGVVVQVKAGAPAPTGSQPYPQPDANWVGLAWITVAAGQAVVQQSNITLFAGPHRIARKLPALGRIAGSAVTTVTGARNLTLDEAGLVMLDLGAWSDDVPIRLPPINSAPGEPLRFTLAGRFLTPRSRRNLSWGRILPSGSDKLDEPFIFCGPNDTIDLVSDGVGRWLWAGTRAADPFVVAAAGSQSIPNALPTTITLAPPGANTVAAWWDAAAPTVVRLHTFSRVRVSGCVTFAYAAGGSRQAYFHVNNQPAVGAGWPWATDTGNTGNLPISLTLAGAATGVYDGDLLQLVVYQDSGGPLTIDSSKTWIGVETLA